MLEVDRKFDFQHFIYNYINIYGSLQLVRLHWRLILLHHKPVLGALTVELYKEKVRVAKIRKAGVVNHR